MVQSTKYFGSNLGLYIKKPGKKFDPKKIDFDEGDCIWEMAPRYQKNAKWLKITFQGPIWVPEVAFWGLVCIEKWSRNFDSGTRSAIFGTPKMAKKND